MPSTSRKPWRTRFSSLVWRVGKGNAVWWAVAARASSRRCWRAPAMKAFLIKQLADAQDAIHIAAAVHALSGAALGGAKLGKFRFPETQHVGGQLAQFRHFANAEIELVGDDRFDGLGLLRFFFG